MKHDKPAYYYLSKYRSELMGLAILWVVFFHSQIPTDLLPLSKINTAVSFVKGIGYGGVDIFMLVSGMGLYNSLMKNNPADFIKHRIKRIAPTWWLYLIICIVLGALFFEIHYTFSEALGFATFTGYWLDMKNQGNWYIYAIMFFYLISPVLYSLLKESKNRTKTLVILMLITLVISFVFFENKKLMAFSRLPIFIMGMYLSANCKELENDGKRWALSALALVVGTTALGIVYFRYHSLLTPYGLWWYPYILIAPSLSLFTCKAMDVLQKYIKPLTWALAWTGKASLEILLVSDYMFSRFKKADWVIISKGFTPFAVVIISILGGILFRIILDFFINKFEKKKVRN